MDPRIVPCEACGTEGRVYVAAWVHEPGCGYGHYDQVDDGPCPYCDGTGGEIVETEPITIEDMGGVEVGNDVE